MSKHKKQTSLYDFKLQGAPIQYKTLTWKDFQALPDPNSNFIATTYWHISYTYKVFKTQSFATVVIDVKCDITPRS